MKLTLDKPQQQQALKLRQLYGEVALIWLYTRIVTATLI